MNNNTNNNTNNSNNNNTNNNIRLVLSQGKRIRPKEHVSGDLDTLVLSQGKRIGPKEHVSGVSGKPDTCSLGRIRFPWLRTNRILLLLLLVILF